MGFQGGLLGDPIEYGIRRCVWQPAVIDVERL
jgi:hypothetical protein